MSCPRHAPEVNDAKGMKKWMLGHEEGMKIMPSMKGHEISCPCMKGHEISCPGTKGIKFMPLGMIFVHSASPQKIDQRELCNTEADLEFHFQKSKLIKLFFETACFCIKQSL